MALRRWSFSVLKKESGSRLDQFLFRQLIEPTSDLDGVSRSLVRKWILEGKVEMNRRRMALPSRILIENEVIEFYLDPEKEKILGDPARGANRRDGSPGEGPARFLLKDIPIVYEDDAIFIVSKPAGLPTQPTLDPNRQNLFDLLKERAGEEGYVGLHHRLDRDTSGVMVFTNRKEANFGIAEAFKNRDAHKVYLAIVGKSPGSKKDWPRKDFQIENFLKKDDRKKGLMRSVKSGGDAARTTFSLLAVGRDAALYLCRPHTGRMHQIRVHLSEYGFPIVGDEMYGSRLPGRVMLHAAALTLKHPLSGKIQTFTAPIPEDFKRCLSQFQIPLSAVPADISGENEE
jgi:RluA family pseudouridine synthase